MRGQGEHSGFTIIELLVVIAIIGILATIVIVSYSGITKKAHEASLQSDVDSASTLLNVYRAGNHKYPQDPKDANGGKALPASGDNVISYYVSADGKSYCVAASLAGSTAYHKSNITDKIEEGDCSVVDLPTPMQVVTTATCPTTRTRMYDARDNHSYWVQKLADGKCWMLTNLAYVGGGTNTYGDVKILSDGTSGKTLSYTDPIFYTLAGSNVTTEPTDPSISTNGVGQYGYLYNWCAAMGTQGSTAACAASSTPLADPSISVCPAGWRLPVTDYSSGDFVALNNAINGGDDSSDAGLRTVWLGQYAGAFYNNGAFGSQGGTGIYWSSTPMSGGSYEALSLSFYSSSVYAAAASPANKIQGFSVRCLAAV